MCTPAEATDYMACIGFYRLKSLIQADATHGVVNNIKALVVGMFCQILLYSCLLIINKKQRLMNGYSQRL